MTICVAIEESPLFGFLFQPGVTVIEIPVSACSKMRQQVPRCAICRLKLGEVIVDATRRETPVVRQQQALDMLGVRLRQFINQTTHKDEFDSLPIGKAPGLGQSRRTLKDRQRCHAKVMT
jgi:hypothetical protein